MPDSIIDVIAEMRKKFIEAANRESEMANSGYKYVRIHVCNQDTFNIMASQETPRDVKMALEAATFAGYKWVKVD